MAKLLKLVGKKVYHGYDGSNAVKVKEGDIIEVSDDKAEQLLSDYPDNFTAVAKEEADKIEKESRELDLKKQEETNEKVEKTQPKKRGRPSSK